MSHSLPPLMLAAIGEVIGSLVGLLMLLLWVIGQITEGKKQLSRPPGQRPAAPAPPAQLQQPGAAQAGAKPPLGRELGAERQAAGGLRGEMEDFLRRASAQQAGQPGQANRPAVAQRKPQPAQGDKIEVLVDERGRVIDRRRPAEPTRLVEPRTPSTSAPLPSAAKPAPPNPPRREAAANREPVTKRDAVAEHVRQHIDSGTRALAQQSSKLGQRIVKEDAEFDSQLKSKFDHEVGTLASKVRVTDTPSQSPVNTDTTSPAALLSAMLANPLGVQQAILMNEILRRPNERW